VRIGSILASAAEKMYDAGAIAVATVSERALVLESARLPEVVGSATRNLAPNEIADHTFAVAQAFSGFYTECPVLAANTEAERASLCASSLARSSPKSFRFWAST
jgi:arginyl-tRNA synthetase